MLVFYRLILDLIPTALLICTENTVWDITKDGNFVELFQKSFTSYVENGMKQVVEMDIDMLKNRNGGFSVTKEFKAKFYKFIVAHYLRKILFLFPFALDTSNHCLCLLNTAKPGESWTRAHGSEESAGGVSWTSANWGQASELERKKEKKFTWLRKLKPKFRRDERRANDASGA